jgi:glycosyltransferase involved in cell wall biosynthesis
MGLDTAELASFGQNRSYTPGTLHIATVARLHAAKGHLHALAAMHAGLQSGLNLHYTIAGEGPFRDAINLRVQELGLEGRVTVTGTLSEIEVFELLSKVDTFLLPSTGLGEAWPVSVMEAMSAGLPVIASEIGATPEMITPGKDGFLVHQGDEQAILEKISLLAHNVDVRRRIGEAGRRTAQERFDIAGTVNKLRDTIERSLGPGHR